MPYMRVFTVHIHPDEIRRGPVYSFFRGVQLERKSPLYKRRKGLDEGYKHAITGTLSIILFHFHCFCNLMTYNVGRSSVYQFSQVFLSVSLSEAISHSIGTMQCVIFRGFLRWWGFDLLTFCLHVMCLNHWATTALSLTRATFNKLIMCCICVLIVLS